MKVSVCVAATRATTVGATVRSIRAQSHKAWELVLVGQGPMEQIRNAATAEVGDITRLRFVGQDGSGLSRARNAAAAAAVGDILAMIDDDSEAAPDWLEVLVDSFQRHPNVGIVGGALLAPPPEPRKPRNCPSLIPTEASADSGEPTHGQRWIGGNFAMRRATLDVVGGFDEFLGAGAHFPVGEDVDFMLRAEAAGVAVVTAPGAVVSHTYGWRYGVGAVARLQRAYARGNGALAAKLTLAGDERGREQLDEMWRLARRDWLDRRRPVALPAGLRRLYHFGTAYRECVRDFRVEHGLLVRTDWPQAAWSPRAARG